MKVLLLLGAGASISSGLPAGKELTEVLYSSSFFEYAGAYHRGDEVLFAVCTNAVQHGYQFLLDYCRKEERISTGTVIATNYETVFALAEKLSRFYRRIFEGPGIAPYAAMLWPELERIAKDGEMLRAADLCSRISTFIETGLCSILSAKTNPVGYDFVGSLLMADEVVFTTIVSLNHDALLESYLDETLKLTPKPDGLLWIDGFGPPDGDVRWFNHIYLRKSKKKHRLSLLKLHGSINWYRYRIQEGDKYEDKIAKVLDSDPEYAEDARGNRLSRVDEGRVILTGQEKDLIYNSGVFAALHLSFLRELDESDIVITSGFSWNDLGIALRLLTWAEEKSDRTIAVLHKHPATFIQESRGRNLTRFWDLESRGILHVVPYFMSELSWSELRTELSTIQDAR